MTSKKETPRTFCQFGEQGEEEGEGRSASLGILFGLTKKVTLMVPKTEGGTNEDLELLHRCTRKTRAEQKFSTHRKYFGMRIKFYDADIFSLKEFYIHT